MSFEEEFDKILRQKAEDAKYPFDEGGWEKASRLLDADRKAARVFHAKKYYLPAVLLVGLGSAILITLNLVGSDSVQQRIVTLNQRPVEQHHERVSEPVASAKNILPQATYNERGPENHTSEKIKASVAPTTSVQPLAEASATEKTKMDVEMNKVQSKTKSDPVSSQLIPVVQSEPAKEQSPVPASQNETPKQTDFLNENPVNTTYAKSDIIEKESATSDLKTLPVVETSSNAVQASEKLSPDQLTSVYSALPIQLSDPEIIPLPFSILPRYDDDYYNKAKKNKTHFLNAEIGGSYLLGWNTDKGTDGKGFNYFGGLNYGFYISRKISLGIGAQFYNVNHIEQPFYSASHTEYSFGATTVYTLVTSNQLYFASVPFKINYAINSSNTVGVGVNAGYLVGAASSIKTYRLNPEFTSEPESTKNSSIYEGTSLKNLLLTAHYKTQLCPRVAVNAEFIYGLSDLFKNMGEIKNTEKPIGFRLSLQYTLFDK